MTSEICVATITISKLGILLSRMHPMVVHFPIAMVMAAAVAEALGFTRQFAWARGAARFCLLVGAAGVLAAVTTGWLKFICGPATGSVDPDTNLHRWVGTITGIWVLALAIISEVAHRRRQTPQWQWFYRGCLVLGVAMVGATGHLGGALIYGKEYLSLAGL